MLDPTNTASSLACKHEDSVRERREDDATTLQVPFSSSFTAINQQQIQLLTPHSSTTEAEQRNEVQRRVINTAKRRRNSTVARYLGLGNSDEPRHLEKYALGSPELRNPSSILVRKRQKLGEAEDTVKPFGARGEKLKDGPIQRRVLEGLRVTKPGSKSSTARSKASQKYDACDEVEHPQAGDRQTTVSSKGVAHQLPHDFAAKRRLDDTTRNATEDTSSVILNENHPGVWKFDINPSECDTNLIEPFECSQVSAGDQVFDDEEVEDHLNVDLLQLTSDMLEMGGCVHGLLSSPLNPDVAQAQPGLSATGPIIEEEGHSTQRTAKKFVSPITLTTRLLVSTGDIDTREARKPIVRSPFPVPVRDRSPIIGLSSNKILRTCFRIGEIISQAHQADKTGKDITFELYARILDSERDQTKQRFTFCDLFHGKPPYLKARYDVALWGPIQLFNYDGKRLLRQGRIGRCMGTMKREGKEWTMTVLNIWEATWEDIKWVEGIVNP